MTPRNDHISDPSAVAGTPLTALDLRDYLRVLNKFKWGILGVALLAGLVGLYSAYKSVPIYSSTATLQIERDGGPKLGDLFLYTFQLEFYQTQYELIRSWGVAELAAERLGLLDLDSLEGEVTRPEPSGFSWRRLVPDFLRTPDRPASPDVRRDQLIAGIQQSIKVKPIEQSELARVSIEHRDPAEAARIANEVAHAYIDFLRDKNLSEITDEQGWYASRLEQARRDLGEAETALQDFLDRQGLIQTAGGVDAMQSQALQMALQQREEARQKKLELERLNRDIQAAESVVSLSTITALEPRGIVRQLKNDVAEARQEVSKLANRYGPKHPRMIEAQSRLESTRGSYQEELQAVAKAVVGDYQRAKQTEAFYDTQLRAAEADVQSLNRSRAELTKLQDAVNTSRSLLEQLQSGEKSAGLMEGGTQKIAAVIIEFARPGLYPIRPNKLLMILIWTVLGVLAGVGLAFMLDHLDNTFRGSEDVERRTHLPVLGQLPQLKIERGEKLAPMEHFIKQKRTAFSESIRTIRTGVMLSTLDQPKSIIMVTSSLPGEGKTTLAINLAHSIHQMKRTLLIDADMRRPMVHRAKRIEQPRPGLAGMVTGEATFDAAREEQEDGLHVIPSGTVPPNPLELLSSKRFQTMLQQLQEAYEVIIIDSAPALAVSDALVVSQLVDTVLYVIRADATPHQAVEQGIKRLRRANAPLLGAVLNQVSTHGRGYYGKYGRYYRAGRYGRYGYYGDYLQDYYGDETKEEAA